MFLADLVFLKVPSDSMRYAFRGLSLAIVVWTWGSLVLGQTPSADLIAHYSEAGQSALAEGRYAEAESAFEKLKELEPGVPEVRANLGAIYFQERKYDKAVPELRQAVKLKPSLTKAGTLLAIALSETGKYKEAIPGL